MLPPSLLFCTTNSPAVQIYPKTPCFQGVFHPFTLLWVLPFCAAEFLDSFSLSAIKASLFPPSPTTYITKSILPPKPHCSLGSSVPKFRQTALGRAPTCTWRSDKNLTSSHCIFCAAERQLSVSGPGWTGRGATWASGGWNWVSSEDLPSPSTPWFSDSMSYSLRLQYWCLLKVMQEGKSLQWEC